MSHASLPRPGFFLCVTGLEFWLRLLSFFRLFFPISFYGPVFVKLSSVIHLCVVKLDQLSLYYKFILPTFG